MPSTVQSLFTASGAEAAGVVPWGTTPDLAGPGIYVVSCNSNPKAYVDSSEHTVSIGRCQRLLSVRPELRMNGIRPDATALRKRIARFWIPDEAVLYIGLAGTSVSKRVRDYYRTPLGARAPHSGGWFMKTLDNLSDLSVHYADCDDPSVAEAKALAAFVAGVSDSSRDLVDDGEPVMPFANLEYPRGTRKPHGIQGAREPRSRPKGRSSSPSMSEPSVSKRPKEAMTSVTPNFRTQRITGKDLKKGQIRIPQVPKDTKALFPNEKARITVDLCREHLIDCRWNPQPGRSGLIGIGKAKLNELVCENTILRVEKVEDRFRLSRITETEDSPPSEKDT